MNPFTTEHVLQLLERDELTLPSLPEAATQLTRLANDPDATLAAVTHVIQHDPALSARIIGAVNNPLLRGPRPCTTIASAVSRLGMRLIRTMAVGMAVEQLFRAKTLTIDQQMKASWADSVSLGSSSYALARHLGHSEPEHAYLLGAVANIGLLPLLAFCDEQNITSAEGVNPEAIAVVGEAILRHWNFMSDCVDGVRYQLNAPAAACVHLRIAHRLLDASFPVLDEDLTSLGLVTDDLNTPALSEQLSEAFATFA